MDPVIELLTRGVENIYPSKAALEKTLKSGKKLRLYQGFDPSAPSLHLGNFVGIMKLRQFQRLGHQVIFLVGDFTGMIGDPTDKSAARKMLTREEVRKNAQSWKKQIASLLDFEGTNPVQIKYNSVWSDKISFKDLINITSKFTVQQMMERDMFQKRLSEKKPIYLHEFLYPVAQAIDCVEMDVDLEIGGNDQTFNMLAGRQLMSALKNKEKYVLTTKLLVDSHGQKAGKTTGNALFLDSTPENFYGGIMAFSDDLIEPSFELLTEVDMENVKNLISENPLREKKRLAYEVVKLIWGEKAAAAAQNQFENVFQKKTAPLNLPVYELAENKSVIDILVDSKLVQSKSEARRLIDQKAVEVDNKTVDAQLQPKIVDGSIIRVGKTRFIKIKTK